jgi:hypothetical protein
VFSLIQYPNGQPLEKEDLHEETRKLNPEVSLHNFFIKGTCI